jgi:hypothetical protein
MNIDELKNQLTAMLPKSATVDVKVEPLGEYGRDWYKVTANMLWQPNGLRVRASSNIAFHASHHDHQSRLFILARSLYQSASEQAMAQMGWETV